MPLTPSQSSITVPAPNFKTTERARPFLKTAHGWGPTRDGAPRGTEPTIAHDCLSPSPLLAILCLNCLSFSYSLGGILCIIYKNMNTIPKLLFNLKPSCFSGIFGKS